MLLRVIGLRLGEIARRVLHELGHGLLAAEAIGLALKLLIDGAVGLYVLAGRETHRAHVAILAGHGQGCRRHTKQESARDRGREVRSSHSFLLGVRGSSPPFAIECLVADTYNSNLRVNHLPSFSVSA